jgi:hypothetical protein
MAIYNTRLLLKDFPNLKLSYENIIHKKVYNADINLAIPNGPKYFVWFTLVDNLNKCIFINCHNNHIIIKNTCFNHELSYGTILYGTLLTINNREYFTIEDIFLYKTIQVSNLSWGEKFERINYMLSNDLKPIKFNKSFITFTVPLMSSNLNDLITQINANIYYKIDIIQFRLFNRCNNYLFIPFLEFTSNHQPKQYNNTTKNTTKNCIFIVKPTVTTDIYHLFTINEETYFDIAYIPNFNSSVMMNNLFRNIKENNNLDKLEESDDETEFENENIHKFVYLDRSIKMICEFNEKFKKWVPIKLAM